MLVLCNNISLEAADWISVADIIVTTLVGIWIAVVLSNRQSSSRATKDYFISSIAEFHKEYELVFLNLSRGQLSAKEIKLFFKKFSTHLKGLNTVVNKNFKFKIDKLETLNADLQEYITWSNEFNDQHDNAFVQFQYNTVAEITNKVNQIRLEIANIVIDINKK